jgi:alpha-galactosidase
MNATPGTGQVFRLDGADQSFVLSTHGSDGPRLAYWGPRLGPTSDADVLTALADLPVPQGMLDSGEHLAWLPEAGTGFMGHPGISAHRSGRELITQLRTTGFRSQDGAMSINLTDAAAGIQVSLEFEMDGPTGVLATRASLTNEHPGSLTLDWLAAGSLPSPYAELMTFGGRWSREFMSSRQKLASGQITHENRTGRTSHHAPPFMIIGEDGFTENHGEVLGVHLAWSGNHRIMSERLRDGRIQVQAGELLGPGEIVLETGESHTTPWLYLARADDGLNGLSERLHAFVRRNILGERLLHRPRPVHYNTWEAVYFTHDVETLKELARLAASVGAERFVLDDGWFKGRNNDRSSLGDWTVDRTKYPDGLNPLVDHVRSLGLEFGLWVEPEMANADSDLLRAHPEWVLGAPGRDQPVGRHQYVLDLTRTEVNEFIFAQIDALLHAHDISYLKWDMNRDLTHAVSGGRAAAHRQTKAVYALIDRIKAAHPQVEIETCASGGARADYEILKRTDRIWTSECNDPFDRQRIQRAFSIFFPPEVMGAHVGPERSHTTARSASLWLRALTAICGHLGIEADLRGFGPGEKDELAGAIALYKDLRATFHSGRTVRLEHTDPGCIAQACGGPVRWLVTAAQIETPQTVLLAPLRITGLEPEARYAVRLVNPPARASASMKRRTALIRGDTLVVPGRLLERMGLSLPVLRAGEIAAYLITREDG